MATTISAFQIPLSNEVCDFIQVPRGTQITLSREEFEQKIRLSREEVEKNTLIPISEYLCKFIQMPKGTKLSNEEIDRIGKKLVRDNHLIGASWKKLIFNEDDEVGKIYKLFYLSALIKQEAYSIPSELGELLEVPIGVPMNRFDVENQVSEYIRVKKLMRGQTINLRGAENLRKVFALPEGAEEISYNDLMMKIIVYFVEKVKFLSTLNGSSMKIPFTISAELADFLEVAHDTQMNLAQAIRRVAKYTFANTLQVWDCKKNSFTPDEKLRKLFSLPEGTEDITYDALETHVKKHFGVKKYDLNTPLAIPNDMCDFFQVPHSTQMSEIDVIRNLNVYIREKNLQSGENRRAFIPDEKIRTLFAIPEAIREINYYEIRKYLAGKVTYPASNQDPSKSVPIAISDELCDFYEVPHGTKMSKIDAILGIGKYTWNHSLCFRKDTYFTADDKLVKLFDLEIGDEDYGEERKFTFDRIEKLLSKHFIGSA